MVKKILFRIRTVIKKARKEENRRLNPEYVTVGTFLYIDEQGFEFFGWNWYSPSGATVFNIPLQAVQLRGTRGAVTDDDTVARVLKDIGWPDELIEIWKRDPHLT